MLLLMFSDYGPHSLYTYTCSVTGVTATHTHTHTFLCSERATATGAEGERLKEGGSINKSLVCLGTVISSLGELALWLTGSNNEGDNLHLSLGHYLQHYQNCSVHRIIIHVNYVLVKPLNAAESIVSLHSVFKIQVFNSISLSPTQLRCPVTVTRSHTFHTETQSSPGCSRIAWGGTQRPSWLQVRYNVYVCMYAYSNSACTVTVDSIAFVWPKLIDFE